MTPTLFGRIQTRIVMLATIGVVWTAIGMRSALQAALGDGDLKVLAGVDIRIFDETDQNGVKIGDRLSLTRMKVGDERYAQFTLDFGFEKNGKVEKWQLSYARKPGSSDSSPLPDPVKVTRIDNVTWTIETIPESEASGRATAGLRQIGLGGEWKTVTTEYAEGQMPLKFTLTIPQK